MKNKVLKIRIIGALGVIALAAIGIWFYYPIISADSSVITMKNYAVTSSWFGNFARVKKVPSNSIVINKLKIKGKYYPVTFDAGQNMSDPPGANKLALYSQGAQPGTLGNVVVSGHKDTFWGKAIFYNLSKLEVGDEILVTTNDQVFKYAVSSNTTYKIEDFPTVDIFTNSNGSQLTLITCGGKYDRSKKEYPERVVITAVPE